MKKNNLLVAVLFMNIILFSSCNKSIENIPPEAMGDVFVRCQKIGDEVKYAPVYYAFSNYAIKKATVVTGENESIELKKYGNRSTTFRLVPEEDDFTKNQISEATYKFEVTTKQGDVLKVEDKIFADKSLSPVELVKANYKRDSRNSFDIEWKKIDKANFYVVTLRESINGKSLFASKLLASNITKYEFNLDSHGWIHRDINKDDDCTVVVSAYRYENSQSASVYDLNWESIASKKIKW